MMSAEPEGQARAAKRASALSFRAMLAHSCWRKIDSKILVVAKLNNSAPPKVFERVSRGVLSCAPISGVRGQRRNYQHLAPWHSASSAAALRHSTEQHYILRHSTVHTSSQYSMLHQLLYRFVMILVAVTFIGYQMFRALIIPMRRTS